MTRANTDQHPLIADFVAGLSFSLDDFQEEACYALTQNKSVLVAAPTGAGKTIVAEFAVYLAMKEQQKIFYTAPMKALSNQKFNELVKVYGEEHVGILTGDTNINSHAQIVVMTTEVLRNMIYAGSELLDGLAWVIMDEVHYLADRFRGAVWEEVIIHLPQRAKLVSLSATVSNAEEFGDWLQTVRGDTEVIVSENRPIPLHQHVLFGKELVDLFEPKSSRVNRELSRLSGNARNRYQARRSPSQYQRQSQRRISRSRLIEQLGEANLLPAIFFIFSRVGCDAAVNQVVNDGVRLTSAEERLTIREIVEDRCRDILDEDLSILGYWDWLESLQRGVAAHHAGLLPIFKEVIEELFQKKLLKAVFATETLALGINMPARTVVLEKLIKFNGEARVPVTPGEYTQLTGRAGRRGIDTEGHAVILWEDGMNPEDLASLASKRSYPLISSFKPGYNMSVNLIDEFGVKNSRTVLESSFAQFQADRAVVGLARAVHQQEESLAGYAESMKCHLGDFAEFAKFRRELSDVEKTNTRGFSQKQLRKRQENLERLRKVIRTHPCQQCPDRENHARWGERYWQLKRKTDRLRRQIESRTGAVVRTFDRVNQVLIELDYLRRAEAEAEPIVTTSHSALLKRIYGERDLLIAECLRRNIWNELDAAGLAAMASCMVYEPRGDKAQYQPKLPRRGFEEALENTMQQWNTITDLEEANGLSLTQQPSAELALAIFRWANGAQLDRLLIDTELAAGDFVRWVKQMIDLLDQLRKVAPEPVRSRADQAITQIHRGIVAYASV